MRIRLKEYRVRMAHGLLMLPVAVAMLAGLTGCKNSGKDGQVEQQAVAAFMDSPSETAAQAVVADGGKVTMMELPAKLTDRPELILRRKGYTVSYNSRTKTPNWVAWHLTKAHTYGKAQRSTESFTEDNDVAAPRATDQDYYNSRYDRGHMCPAADNKWDAQAMSQSFLFTNICPQNHGLNKYEWNDVEIMCREWARKYGAIDVVCGPIYGSGTANGQQKTIGRNRVWVPDAFFKVVLCRQGEPRAIGFVYRNEGRKQSMAEAVRSVDEIERLTGIDFFPALPDNVERRVEAKAELSKW